MTCIFATLNVDMDCAALREAHRPQISDGQKSVRSWPSAACNLCFLMRDNSFDILQEVDVATFQGKWCINRLILAGKDSAIECMNAPRLPTTNHIYTCPDKSTSFPSF